MKPAKVSTVPPSGTVRRAAPVDEPARLEDLRAAADTALAASRRAVSYSALLAQTLGADGGSLDARRFARKVRKELIVSRDHLRACIVPELDKLARELDAEDEAEMAAAPPERRDPVAGEAKDVAEVLTAHAEEIDADLNRMHSAFVFLKGLVLPAEAKDAFAIVEKSIECIRIETAHMRHRDLGLVDESREDRLASDPPGGT